MSAHEQMRQMLDQLMGTGRDGLVYNWRFLESFKNNKWFNQQAHVPLRIASGILCVCKLYQDAICRVERVIYILIGCLGSGENNRYKVKFSDQRVCKSFLLGCCPHDILASTRMDLGDCPKIHDLALRADYEQACDNKDYYYDIDAMEHLQAFINDCDRRTELAKRRLAETQEELSAEVAAKANKVHDLAEQIGKKLARAEQLGADGNVEESLKLMEEVEEIRKKKLQAEQEYRNSMPASSYQQQKLRVCEVCSAYLGIHDNDRRLADHFGGKLHLGFIKIREKLDELMKCVSDRREKMKGDRECRTGNGGSSRERSETRPRKREHDRDEGRDRGRDRDRKERASDTKRSRSRSRSRGRRSGRRPDSRKRSRSRDRKRSHDDSKSDKSDRRRERSRSRSKDGGRRTSGDRSPKRSIKVEESGRSSVEGLGDRRSVDGDSHRNGGSSE